MAIYITGDTHGDFRRFSRDIFYEQKELTKDDYVIICGDFGGIWEQEETPKEKYWLDWLNSKSFTTLFIDGNHENFERLYSYPEITWKGGQIHVIRPSVFHLMRGQIFDLQGKKFFTFGGASSHDIQDGIIEMDEEGEWKEKMKLWKRQEKMFRIKNLSWWEQEIPSGKEFDEGLKTLTVKDSKVDFVITHCAPQEVASVFSNGLYKADTLTSYLNIISRNVEFSKWFFGHYHDNRAIMGKYLMLYEQIIRIL